MANPVFHHLAQGVHPGAFVQPDEPDTTQVQDGVLWVDISTAAPYQIKVWNATEAAGWEAVGSAGLQGDCLVFPRGQEVCGDHSGRLRFLTPTGEHDVDATGYTLPLGHRLERYSAEAPTPTIVLPEPGFESRGVGWQVTPNDGAAGILRAGDALSFGGVTIDILPAHAADGTHFAYVINRASLNTTFECPLSGPWRLNFAFAFPFNDAGRWHGAVRLIVDGNEIDELGVVWSGTNDWIPYSSAPIDFSVGSHTLALVGAFLAFGQGDQSMIVSFVDQFGWTWLGDAQTEERVRVVHASAGAQLDMPFKPASGPTTAYLAQDPTSGLPVWSTLSALAPQLTAAPLTPPIAPPIACTQVRCGVAQACTEHLSALYAQWANWINAVLATLGGALTALALALALDPLVDIAYAMLWSFLKETLEQLSVAVLGGGCPDLTTENTTTLTNALFCALTCAADVCTVDAAALQAWCNRLITQGWPGLNDLQAVVLKALMLYTPVPEFQALAATAAPSSACDGMTCA